MVAGTYLRRRYRRISRYSDPERTGCGQSTFPRRCPQGSPPLGDRSSASVTEVHDVDGALRVEDPVVKVIPAPPEEQTADVTEERARV